MPDFTNPQCLNRYAYCINNPLSYVDPSGHDFGLFSFIGYVVFSAVVAGAQSDWDPGAMALGAVTGAISAGSFFMAGEIIAGIAATSTVAANALAVPIHAIAGGVSGAINSAITGGDVGMGALTGAIAGGFAEAAGPLIPSGDFQQLIGRCIIGGVTGGIAAEMYGGDFGSGFAQGALTAGAGYLFNAMAHKFAELWKNYPHDINGRHQHPSSDSYAKNQCAIRVSYTLMKTGMNMDSYPSVNKT